MSPSQPELPEKLVTMQVAAEALGLPTWKIRRAVKAGLIPSYSLLNGRRLVRLSEIIAVVSASCCGGQND